MEIVFTLGNRNRLHQHAPRYRRHGDRRVEADGQLQPAPHRRGLQGARHAADPPNGAAEEEAEIAPPRVATPRPLPEGWWGEVSDCFHNVIGVCVLVCTDCDHPHVITKAAKIIKLVLE